MKTITNKDELQKKIEQLKQVNKIIGFVPTMGALHEGHLSLVKKCREGNDICVVSIFVNPIQFNDPEDLRNYPRTPEKDYALLESARTDILFLPSEEEMYPEPVKEHYDLDGLDNTMEGAQREGHFDGVATIVFRLFDLVKPNSAYFGEKDFQQLTIIKHLTNKLNYPVKIIGCPIMREKDGLAMSSRNALLTPGQREKAKIIPQVLLNSASLPIKKTVRELRKFVVSAIEKEKDVNVEYFEIVDAKNLQPVRSWPSTHKELVGCIAVRIGKIRLIDNVKYNL